MLKKNLIWVEISKSALENNIQQLKKKLPVNTILAPVIKGNAYGHGFVNVAKIFEKAGANWFCINSIIEARKLRAAGIKIPLFIMGYIQLSDLEDAVNLDCRILVYNKKNIRKIAKITKKSNKDAIVHIKLETGLNRQGVLAEDLLEFLDYIKQYKKINIEGVSTHFANLENTTDQIYTKQQIDEFLKLIKIIEDYGVEIQIKHCGNSAATLCFSPSYLQLVRIGISSYGMWPSKEIEKNIKSVNLIPALTWKTKIAQIKEIQKNSYIGYSCTYKTHKKTKIAIIPVGYYDGYDRKIKGGNVLIKGKKAPILGRIAMNMIIADISKIKNISLEDEVVLLGKQGNKQITAEEMAGWASTINYEITTRINEEIERIIVE